MIRVKEERLKETKATLNYVYDSVAERIGHTQGTFQGKCIDSAIEEYTQALQVMGNVQKALVTQTIVDIISV